MQNRYASFGFFDLKASLIVGYRKKISFCCPQVEMQTLNPKARTVWFYLSLPLALTHTAECRLILSSPIKQQVSFLKQPSYTWREFRRGSASPQKGIWWTWADRTRLWGRDDQWCIIIHSMGHQKLHNPQQFKNIGTVECTLLIIFLYNCPIMLLPSWKASQYPGSLLWLYSWECLKVLCKWTVEWLLL